MKLVPYAGAPRQPRGGTRPAAADGPLGVRAIAFLRRIRAHRGYQLADNTDREAAERAEARGMITRHGDCVRLTAAGRAFLDRLMRVE